MVSLDVDAVRDRLGALRERPADTLPVETVAATLRDAAVLLLLWEEFGEVWLALTRRGATLRAHAGEVSLPGGACEPGEEPPETALRETVEETGIDARQVTIFGRLDDAWTRAGFRVVPVVAWHYGVPQFRPDGAEVVEVTQVVVAELSDPENHEVRIVSLGDIEYEDDVLHCSGLTVVGATADIVLDLVHWLGGQDRRRRDARLAGLHFVAGSGGLR
jgi:8-oxo-dGTP pyrophosphatase MutT (NUDIX family)